MKTKAEKYYDKHIGPKLLELGQDAQQHGLSFLAVVEWTPGENGTTWYTQKQLGLDMLLAGWGAACKGNIDALWMQIQKFARVNGHRSVLLHEQGIPMKPNKKEPA